MNQRAYRLVNAVTIYRIVVTPFLIYLVLSNQLFLFRWFILLSFFTDAIDGYLARSYKVTSVLGSRLDSIGDDLTVSAGILALYIMKPEIVQEQWIWLLSALLLFIVQNSLSLIKFKKTTSFHTYISKTAAVIQSFFLIAFFFFSEPAFFLFYPAVIITSLGLLEEIVMILILPQWKSDVKGIFSALKIKAELIRQSK